MPCWKDGCYRHRRDQIHVEPLPSSDAPDASRSRGRIEVSARSETRVRPGAAVLKNRPALWHLVLRPESVFAPQPKQGGMPCRHPDQVGTPSDSSRGLFRRQRNDNEQPRRRMLPVRGRVRVEKLTILHPPFALARDGKLVQLERRLGPRPFTQLAFPFALSLVFSFAIRSFRRRVLRSRRRFQVDRLDLLGQPVRVCIDRDSLGPVWRTCELQRRFERVMMSFALRCGGGGDRNRGCGCRRQLPLALGFLPPLRSESSELVLELWRWSRRRRCHGGFEVEEEG